VAAWPCAWRDELLAVEPTTRLRQGWVVPRGYLRHPHAPLVPGDVREAREVSPSQPSVENLLRFHYDPVTGSVLLLEGELHSPSVLLRIHERVYEDDALRIDRRRNAGDRSLMGVRRSGESSARQSADSDDRNETFREVHGLPPTRTGSSLHRGGRATRAQYAFALVTLRIDPIEQGAQSTSEEEAHAERVRRWPVTRPRGIAPLGRLALAAGSRATNARHPSRRRRLPAALSLVDVESRRAGSDRRALQGF